MKVKESFGSRLLMHWFGVKRPFDEYKHQQIGRIGTNAYMILAVYLFVSSIVAIFVGQKDPEEVLMWLVMINIVMVGFVVNIYILVAMMRAHIATREIRATSRRQVIGKAVLKGIGLAIYFGVFMLFADVLIDWHFDDTSPVKTIENVAVIWSDARSGLFFGIAIAIYEILTTKIYKE
ncbi:DUF3278 domain-containing protein [Lentilactobacillus parakefiri]|uniref:DUF3278 domain-containing protein n=1 Tax=Lentilactobacillus parakefiri TaxID=152332 RepID=A0A224VCT8_9LACO|nr:DUF3278 domain-containing protein [Lentilactobacillus parakefiri]KRL52398.1 hypothetical protein FD08_GL000143 [Lentilactobacillus parakefiri DSM 10551]PAK99772.1 hypothetical protein B8W96_09905 [Lentilactobacillus parakefiri]TDG94379.1 hypothetical protein C5L28_001887 [Lentilactobacillus parakefiri]GAW72755.1 hypothetical protein LPKJCM_01885 [Lentilactobacillus parakefiri]